jgi:hypothetical protein
MRFYCGRTWQIMRLLPSFLPLGGWRHGNASKSRTPLGGPVMRLIILAACPIWFGSLLPSRGALPEKKTPARKYRFTLAVNHFPAHGHRSRR